MCLACYSLDFGGQIRLQATPQILRWAVTCQRSLPSWRTLDGLLSTFCDLLPDAEAILRTMRSGLARNKAILILFPCDGRVALECRNKSTLSRWGPMCTRCSPILIRDRSSAPSLSLALGGFPIIRSFEKPGRNLVTATSAGPPRMSSNGKSRWHLGGYLSPKTEMNQMSQMIRNGWRLGTFLG